NIMSGNLISKLDAEPTMCMSISEAVKRIRGEPNTSIVLTIQRQGRDKPLVIPIVRDHIQVRSVRAKMLESDIAYIRIAQFQERTEADLARHVADLARQGAREIGRRRVGEG